MSQTDAAKLIVISGPAGSGKTTLCERMLAEVPGVQRVITSTTRSPRDGERHGIDYYFFTHEHFRQKVAAGEFYEYAKVHTNYYGSLKSEIDDKLAAGMDVLLNIDVQGAASFRQAAQDSATLKGRLVTIFVSISPEQMRERMVSRGDVDEDDIARRLLSAVNEQARVHEFDYVIESKDREADFTALKGICSALRAKK